MSLYLIRHPQPVGVRGLCYGRRDVGIEPESLAAAVSSVRRRLGGPLLGARIFSSPASRCLLLARELAAPRQPTLDDALREMNFGAWEGLAWDAVPRDELDAWAADVWSYSPGGAESAAMVAQRWQRWQRGWAGESGDAVVVTHAGVIRVALRCSGQLSSSAFSRAVIDYGSVHRIEAASAPALVSA
jgi:alpha-ribazole phosphatase